MKRFFLRFGICLLAAVVLGAQDQTGGSGSGTGDPATGDPSAGGGDPNADAATTQDPLGMTPADVMAAVQAASLSVNSPKVIAVTNRQGQILALYKEPGAPDMVKGNFGTLVKSTELAVGLARTASFFSHNQAPLTSRTVRFISGIHFPPGIMFTGPADLYGIENTNRGCSFNVDIPNLPRATSVDGTGPGAGIVTGKADLFDSDPAAVNPGGVPLFKTFADGTFNMAGGIGVVALTPQIAEYAAFSASVTPPFFVLAAAPPPAVVLVGGFTLPEIFQTTQPAGTSPSPAPPAGSVLYTPTDPNYLVAPMGSPAPAPDKDLVKAHDGQYGLSAADVQTIVNNSVAAANSIRGVIRLPLGTRAHMVIAVSDLDGTLLGLYRMPDATIFSVDVAVAKSRYVIYFTRNPAAGLPGIKPGTAVTNRTIGFGAMPIYPPGIDYGPRGPFFDLFKYDVANPCTQGFPLTTPDPVFNPANSSGIVFFPGATPLYKNGVLVGGLGISGDGVDQDDFVTNSGAAGFDAPLDIRADRVMIQGVRLPFFKFPRDPQN